MNDLKNMKKKRRKIYLGLDSIYFFFLSLSFLHYTVCLRFRIFILIYRRRHYHPDAFAFLAKTNSLGSVVYVHSRFRSRSRVGVVVDGKQLPRVQSSGHKLPRPDVVEVRPSNRRELLRHLPNAYQARANSRAHFPFLPGTVVFLRKRSVGQIVKRVKISGACGFYSLSRGCKRMGTEILESR